jgi:hypothetical protein
MALSVGVGEDGRGTSQKGQSVRGSATGDMDSAVGDIVEKSQASVQVKKSKDLPSSSISSPEFLHELSRI